MNNANQPNKIIVHHSADSFNQEQFQRIDLYHKSRGFDKSELGFWLGYHYLIEKSGLCRQGRNENEIGSHCIGQNDQSIGICLAGNFDSQTPTANQKISLVKLIDYLTKKWQIPANQIFPHRKFTATTCYGIMLSDDWARTEYVNFLKENLIHLLTILKALLEKLIAQIWNPQKHSD